MKVEQLKEKYESGDYVCYFNKNIDEWSRWIKYDFNEITRLWDDYSYALIHKKHSHIADAVIANPDVEVEYYGQVTDKGYEEPDLFKNYNERRSYRLKPQEDSFIDEVFDMPIMGAKSRELIKQDFNGDKTISITAEDGTEYKFEKPIEPIKFYEVMPTGHIFGRVLYGMEWYPEVWNVKTGSSMSSEVDLTPIKKPWYEDERNFPCLVKEIQNGRLSICFSAQDYCIADTLATKEEALSLVVDAQV